MSEHGLIFQKCPRCGAGYSVEIPNPLPPDRFDAPCPKCGPGLVWYTIDGNMITQHWEKPPTFVTVHFVREDEDDE